MDAFEGLSMKEMDEALNMMNISAKEREEIKAYAQSKEAQDYMKNIDPKEMEEFMKNDKDAQMFMKNGGFGAKKAAPKKKAAAAPKKEPVKEVQVMDDDFYQPREELLQMQNMQVSQHIKREESKQEKIFNFQEDETSKANLCTKPQNELKPVRLKELRPGEIQPDTIIWLTIISDAAATSSVNFIVEDEAKTAMICSLYNLMPKDAKLNEIQNAVPVGLKFGLKQPYIKMGMIGMSLQGTIRNDNPENLIREFKPAVDAKTLKEEGNQAFTA